MGEWQPIETALRNKRIDLGQLYASGMFVRAPDCYWHKKMARWMCKHHDKDGYSLIRMPFTPTHWMPLPTPPSPAPEKESR